MSVTTQPPRTPWGAFPDVLIHASESAVKQHPAYQAAQTGDGHAAIVLVSGTLANFKGYIESKGDKVLAAVSLTGKPHSAKLAWSPVRLQELRGQHGTKLEGWLCERFAHTFDALTESEARYLAHTEGADSIRSRIAAAK